MFLGEVLEAINRDLGGSFGKFRNRFNAACMSVFGSGWAFVTVTPSGQLISSPWWTPSRYWVVDIVIPLVGGNPTDRAPLTHSTNGIAPVRHVAGNFLPHLLAVLRTGEGLDTG